MLYAALSRQLAWRGGGTRLAARGGGHVCRPTDRPTFMYSVAMQRLAQGQAYDTYRW